MHDTTRCALQGQALKCPVRWCAGGCNLAGQPHPSCAHVWEVEHSEHANRLLTSHRHAHKLCCPCVPPCVQAGAGAPPPPPRRPQPVPRSLQEAEEEDARRRAAAAEKLRALNEKAAREAAAAAGEPGKPGAPSAPKSAWRDPKDEVCGQGVTLI